MRCRYSTYDVFTDTRFGGNQLAVLPEADGLSDEQMQQIARELNYSETTFVLPPQAGHACRVRIFTPPREVPFAGHPNIGTAFVLATMGVFGPLDAPSSVTFEEQAGLVPIAIHKCPGQRIWCELTAPQSLTLGKTISAQSMAAAVSLTANDILTTAHAPQVASVGLPFVIAELRDRDALERARPDITGLEGLVAEGFEQPDVHLYVRTSDGFDIRARMFSPLDGIPEDPATGSANCALVGLLSHLDEAANGAFSWRISQGVEMGRPSVLEARAEKRDGAVVNVWIGGECVLVSEGLIDVRRQRRPTSRQPPDLLIVVSSTSSPTPSGASGLVDANLALVSSVSSVSRRSGQGT
jgi:trans-2,3-dihydro-3-hydroxyanthranilate isomerase